MSYGLITTCWSVSMSSSLLSFAFYDWQRFLRHCYIMFVFSHICAFFRKYTPQPLYNTIVGVQSNCLVSYPIRVVSGVECIDYIEKGVLIAIWSPTLVCVESGSCCDEPCYKEVQVYYVYFLCNRSDRTCNRLSSTHTHTHTHTQYIYYSQVPVCWGCGLPGSREALGICCIFCCVFFLHLVWY